MNAHGERWSAHWEALKQNAAFQIALVFGSGAWFVVQAADIFDLPTGLVRWLGAGMLSVFVILAVYAWFAALRAVRQAAAAGTEERGAGGGRNVLRSRAVVAAAAALLLLGVGAWWAGPRLFGGVRPGADVIAVLPFAASGASVELLGEGLVDLLSTNLDEAGSVRTIDPRTTLHQWRRAGGATAGLNLDGAIDVGRAVGAGSVLLGSVVEAAGEVRLTAELYGMDGGTLARAQASGPSNDVFSLVDELSVDLLREIWRSSEPLPDLRLSAITTSSPAALRAYLRGEQYFRTARWDSARASLELAVAEDSTFALAHFRLGESFGWTEGLGSAAARRYSDAAARFADRLPARERSLVIAHQLHERADLAAIDSLRAYTSRYPDDVGGWHLYADARFHALAVLGLALEDARGTFERVVGLDPSFAPAYQHALELDVALDDSAAFSRHLAAWSDATDADRVHVYGSLGVLVWGDRAAALDTFSAAVDRHANSAIDVNRLLSGMLVQALSGPEPDADVVLDALKRGRALLPASMSAGLDLTRIQMLVVAGRVREATRVLDSLRAVNPDIALNAAVASQLSPLAPADFAAPEREKMDSLVAAGAPGAVFWAAMSDALHGRTAPARVHAESVLAKPDSAVTNPPRSAFAALIAWLDALEGDAGRLDDAFRHLREAGYANLGGNTAPLLFGLAIAQASVPGQAAQAIARIDAMTRVQPAFLALMYEPIAGAYERVGQPQRAAEIYAMMIALWEDGADPEIAPQIEAARRALRRLTGEAAATR